jgi:hypothetical protein
VLRASRGRSGRCNGALILCALFAFGLFALASSALAETSARVVLVSGSEPVLARKLRAEAEAAGLRVIEVGPDAAAAEAGELMARHQAAAVIRLVSADRAEVEVGVADGAISRTLTRRSADGESFALRVVEEVYARLVELRLVEPRADSASHPSRLPGGEREAGRAPDRGEDQVNPNAPSTPGSAQPMASPAPIDRRSARAATGADPRLFLSGGLGLSQPAGGISGTVHGVLGVRLEPVRRFAAAAHAFLPLTENNLDEPEGSADINVNLFLGQVDYAIFESARTLSLNAGVGAGVLALAMRGEAQEPRSGLEQRTLAGVYFAHSSMSWSAAAWFRLRGTLLGGLSAPRPVLRFENREVATWGRPFVGAVVASEFGVPLTSPGASQ